MITQVSFHGPKDALDDALRSGTPDYPGGNIHPVDPEAAARLHEFWRNQPSKGKARKAREDNPAVALERTVFNRLKERAEQLKGRTGEPTTGEHTMNRTQITPAEMTELARMVADGAPDAALLAWKDERGINGNSLRSAVRGIRARQEQTTPQNQVAVIRVPAAAVAAPPMANGRPELAPIINWLSTIRDMRDELSEHGVTVEGTLSITIDL